MTTLNEKSTVQFIAQAAAVGLFILAVIYCLTLAGQFFNGLQHLTRSGDPSQSQEYYEPAALPTFVNPVDPATALTNGQPTLFMFYPTAVCAIQYCDPPELISQDVRYSFGSAINFVLVPTHVMPYTESRHHVDYLPFENWNILPVEPYVSWLPQLTDTQFGWGLDEVKLVFVSADGSSGKSVPSVEALTTLPFLPAPIILNSLEAQQ